MELFDRVVLLEDIEGTAFIKGDIATLVEIYPDKDGYELEFFAVDGSTLGVEAVSSNKVISCKGFKNVLHIRNIAA